MATQYTAGLSTGQVLTAATMNSIGAAWETWTANPVPATGTGTLTTSKALYARIQKIVIFRLDVVVATIGTSAGQSVNFTLPVALGSTAYNVGGALGSGREYQSAGYQVLVLALSTTSGRISKYDAAGIMAAGQSYSVICAYEAP